jgi:Subtilase family
MSRSSTEVMGTPDELYHWIPGEMVVVVRLPRLPVDDTLELLAEQIRTQLSVFLAQYRLTLEPYGTHGRWLEVPTMPPVRRHAFLFGFHRKQPLMALFFHTRHLDQPVRDALPMALSYIQAHLEELAQIGLHILSAMPNWLMTSAPFFYEEGGVAFPPRPAPIPDVATPTNTLPGWHVKLLDQHIPLVNGRGADDVLVAVLDTAIHPDRIQRAASRPELRQNWLLQRLANDLRSEDGSFVVEYDRYALTSDVRTGRNQTNESRFYSLPDHGLSVAGLVRDVAPRARIRMIRVLNDFGGGDLYSLFACLTDLERELVAGRMHRLIINLSLTIMPDIRRLPFIWFAHRQWPTTQLMGTMRVLHHIEEGLRLLFECLAAQGALIVAAAGNDSLYAHQRGQPSRPPRAPARYESTLSVTAVNCQFAPATFANAANVPPIDAGVATLGGDSYGAVDSNGWPDAVRGLYISPKFPDSSQNTSGWADWSGTSVATPIISGLASHLMSQGWSASNIITRLSAPQEQHDASLFGSPPELTSLLANIIRVEQRYGL